MLASSCCVTPSLTQMTTFHIPITEQMINLNSSFMGLPGCPPKKNFENFTLILVGIKIHNNDISVSHRLPVGRNLTYKGKVTEPAIIVKFVSQDVKDYWTRKRLKEITTRNLGYEKENFIYINGPQLYMYIKMLIVQLSWSSQMMILPQYKK